MLTPNIANARPWVDLSVSSPSITFIVLDAQLLLDMLILTENDRDSRPTSTDYPTDRAGYDHGPVGLAKPEGRHCDRHNSDRS